MTVCRCVTSTPLLEDLVLRVNTSGSIHNSDTSLTTDVAMELKHHILSLTTDYLSTDEVDNVCGISRSNVNRCMSDEIVSRRYIKDALTYNVVHFTVKSRK